MLQVGQVRMQDAAGREAAMGVRDEPLRVFSDFFRKHSPGAEAICSVGGRFIAWQQRMEASLVWLLMDAAARVEWKQPGPPDRRRMAGVESWELAGGCSW